MQQSYFQMRTIAGLMLLLTLLFAVFILPVFSFEWQGKTSLIVYTILYFSAFFSLEKRKRSILVLSIFAFFTEWFAGIFSIWAMATVSKSLNVIFFLIIVVTLVYQVSTARKVTLEVILGAIIGYLMLGLVYSIFVAFIMQQDPGAYNITQNLQPDFGPITHLGESIYYTFITLTTVGYGDILPVKPYTRSLSVLISVSGQLYIAIIIALLVGKFASDSDNAKSG